jgi:hypothetical protein
MSCAYRTHRYRASVTARPTSVFWEPTTGHAHHPALPRSPVVRPGRQAVMETADDAPIPMSLVQYLWAQWQESPPDVRNEVTVIISNLMQSPRWRWDVTVLRDQSPPDPQHPFVFERDGRPTIGMPIAMLRDLWRWVWGDIDKQASVLRWLVPPIDPALWQELRTHRPAYAPSLTKQEWYRLYGYLSPPPVSRHCRGDAPAAPCHIIR